MKNPNINASLLNGLYVSTAGMLVQNKRVLVISENMANSSSRSDENGNEPYRRKTISFKEEYNKEKGVTLVAIRNIKGDKTPFSKVYDPNDSGADAEGYVQETNVKPMIELSDMREAGRSHEANVKVFEKVLQMLQSTISILKPQ